MAPANEMVLIFFQHKKHKYISAGSIFYKNA